MNRAVKTLLIFAAFAVIVTLGRHALHSSTTTTTTTTVVSPVVTTTTVATPTTTTTVATTTGTDCAASGFRAAYVQGQGSLGTVYDSVTLTKTSPGACTLQGWPLVTLADRHGAVVATTNVDVPGSTQSSPITFPASAANAAPTTLHLTTGSTVAFALAYSDVPIGNETCPSAYALRVQLTAGGGVIPVTAQYPLQPCGQFTLWLSPFYSTAG
ncbi:MAG: DUF4232 domain-containing protein [Acidimicrobiales bacterium]